MHHAAPGTATAVHPEEDLAPARVADLARDYPGTIRVFQRYRIDFCCGGKRSVAEAAERAQVALPQLLADLRGALDRNDSPLSAAATTLPDSLGDLGHMIVGRYHVALRMELPRLVAMADRVEKVHGAEMPDVLPALATTVRSLAAELMHHMAEEEDDLFPAIRRLERAARRGESGPAEDLAQVVAAREDEHTAAGEHLATLRKLSNDFVPPDWACNTFRGLYHGLAQLETELHEHIHLENNILFPRALALAGCPAS